jgi:hypothetical protein
VAKPGRLSSVSNGYSRLLKYTVPLEEKIIPHGRLYRNPLRQPALLGIGGNMRRKDLTKRKISHWRA